MAIVLHDLAGANPDLRFSPYCWATKFALAHKGLTAETIPWRFTEKDALAFSGQGAVPVMRDGDRVISDSWAIAQHLEDTRPGAPLFGSDTARAHALFIRSWADAVMVPGIARCIVRDLWDIIDPKDRTYFRETRERWLGGPLEQVQAGRDQGVIGFRDSLRPIRLVLRAQPFLGGNTPSYADHIIAGMLMWPHCASHFPLLTDDDPIAVWFGRIQDAYGGLGRSAKRV